MRFVIDAQLPAALAKFLTQKGFDVVHTDDLPKKEFTTDNEIREISVRENHRLPTVLLPSAHCQLLPPDYPSHH